eukprot:TRINITY_DN2709_c1_g3_i1.p1 TRINITY_DN2709_c1_g3~~TRINITY_DN2709_c1_g3_i1.p1  ORF type:complete len:135 (-),score=6.59 TRINITY_DN2709_c1_g3_i1:271-675(-)
MVGGRKRERKKERKIPQRSLSLQFLSSLGAGQRGSIAGPHKDSPEGTLALGRVRELRSLVAPQHFPHDLHVLVSARPHIVVKLKNPTPVFTSPNPGGYGHPSLSHGENHLLPPIHDTNPNLPPPSLRESDRHLP